MMRRHLHFFRVNSDIKLLSRWSGINSMTVFISIGRCSGIKICHAMRPSTNMVSISPGGGILLDFTITYRSVWNGRGRRERISPGMKPIGWLSSFPLSWACRFLNFLITVLPRQNWRPVPNIFSDSAIFLSLTNQLLNC